MFEGDGTIPRDGEFTILAGSEVATEWVDATGLIFNENAIEGKPEWDKVVEGDIIRLVVRPLQALGPLLIAGRLILCRIQSHWKGWPSIVLG